MNEEVLAVIVQAVGKHRACQVLKTVRAKGRAEHFTKPEGGVEPTVRSKGRMMLSTEPKVGMTLML